MYDKHASIVRTGCKTSQTLSIVATHDREIELGLGLVAPVGDELLIFLERAFKVVEEKMHNARLVLTVIPQASLNLAMISAIFLQGSSANLNRRIDRFLCALPIPSALA